MDNLSQLADNLKELKLNEGEQDNDFSKNHCKNLTESGIDKTDSRDNLNFKQIISTSTNPDNLQSAVNENLKSNDKGTLTRSLLNKVLNQKCEKVAVSNECNDRNPSAVISDWTPKPIIKCNLFLKICKLNM